jgi:AcrR family transcriptional regulator
MTAQHDFQRARSEEQVQQRRDDIVKAARHLLETDGSASVTLVAIGKHIGLAKSNIYRYFDSREDILCEIFLQESDALADELCDGYRGIPRRNDLSNCATVFANACASRSMFCVLHTELAGTLDQHISAERLVSLKTEFARLMNRTAQALETAAPDLGENGSIAAVRMFLHQLAGCWPFCHLSDAAQTAVDNSDYSRFSQPFRKTFSQACYVILLGLAQIDEEDAFFDT